MNSDSCRRIVDFFSPDITDGKSRAAIGNSGVNDHMFRAGRPATPVWCALASPGNFAASK